MSQIYGPPPPSIEALVALKQGTGQKVSVCLPALNEAGTIGTICDQIRPLRAAGVVDELVVVDSGSSDGTLEVAGAAGATGFEASRLPPRDQGAEGKGGTLWKSLSVLSGDVVVWLDSDTRNFDPAFVTSLIAPLLADSSIDMVKAFYERPIESTEGVLSTGGARVTELVVRPLAHLLFPELTGFVQPLSGEYACRREILMDLPFFTGFGVEVGLLIDLIAARGLDRIVQVDLGSRIHRNQDTLALGRMAFQVMQVMIQRAEDLGRLKVVADWPEQMIQFVSDTHGASPVAHRLAVRELPPMRGVS